MTTYLDTLRQRLTQTDSPAQTDTIDLLDEPMQLQVRGGDKEFTPMGPAAESLHESWQMPSFLFRLT